MFKLFAFNRRKQIYTIKKIKQVNLLEQIFIENIEYLKNGILR